MTMQVGFFVLQDNAITESINQKIGPSFYLECCRIAETAGYDSFWLPDHWLLSKNKGPFDCWGILAAASAVTERIRLGSLVTPITAYPPLVLAKRVLTVQMLSNGRTNFGLGAGWNREAFEGFGVAFEHYEKRVQMLEEAVQLIKLVWNSEEPVDFAGKYYSAHKCLLRPKVKSPPFWLGGASRSLLGIVSKYGDGWIPFEITAKDFANKLKELHYLLERVGRKTGSIETGLAARIVTGRTEKEVAASLRRVGISAEYTLPDLPGELKGHFISGTYDQCARELGEFIDAGVSHLVLSPQPADLTAQLLPVIKNEIVSGLR